MSDLFGELERFASEELYPYRLELGIGAIVGVIALVWLAYRLRLHETVARHPIVTAAIVIPVLAVTIPTGYYLVSPLFERTHLEEASPLAEVSINPVADGQVVDGESGSREDEQPAEPAATQATGTDPPPSSFEPRLVLNGEINGADDFHFGRGQALLIETEPGRYVLRFEEFSVRNGPDLFVLLSPGEDDEGGLVLGELKATDGAFNYDVPEGTDISQFRYAIVWCENFSVLFASAELGPA